MPRGCPLNSVDNSSDKAYSRSALLSDSRSPISNILFLDIAVRLPCMTRLSDKPGNAAAHRRWPLYRLFRFSLSLFQVSILILGLSACAEIKVVPIPAPTDSPKLRVYVEAFTTFAAGGKHGNPGWNTSHEEFVEYQVAQVQKYLAQTGIYEIVRGEDVHTVIGDQKLTRYLMERNDWALAKEIGRALHADYVMVLERGTNSLLNERYFFNALINVDSGKKFGVQYSFQRKGIQSQMKEIILASYRDIFSNAKDDLFATAIKKGQRIGLIEERKKEPELIQSSGTQLEAGRQTAKTSAPPQVPLDGRRTPPPADVTAPAKVAPPLVKPQNEQQPEQTRQAATQERKDSQPIQSPEPGTSASLSGAAEQVWVKEKEIEGALTQIEAVSHGAKLVVYDFYAPEQYKPAALIYSEALREEIFKLRKFTLVNREDLDQMLKEIALQQTGLIDEKDAVKTGKGLAANQVVTGRMGLVGKTFILQAKRISVETFSTLSLASLRFSSDHEDDAFDKMTDFAKQLSGE